jgi:hypothetical protein
MGTQGAEHGRLTGDQPWAIAALVAAMIVVGAMGFVLRASAGQGSTADKAPSANAPAQSH